MKTEKLSILAMIIIFDIFLFAYPVSAVDMEKPLNLEESVQIALKQSAIIDSAKEGVKASEFREKESFTNFLPKLSTSYSYSRLNEPPQTKADITDYRPLIVGTKDNYNWTLELKQTLFAGGKIMAGYQANKIGLDISRSEENSVIQDIVLETTVTYFNILKTQRFLDVARQSVEQRSAQRDLSKSYYDVGLIPKNDLLTAEVELANGKQLLVKAENGVETAKARFNTTLRRGVNTPVTIEDILKYEPFEKSLDECLAVAQKNRPEIKAFSLRIDQAKKQVEIVKSEFYPVVNLFGKYGRFGDTPGVAGSLYQDAENWSVTAVASWDLWEWGRTKYSKDASLSRQKQAENSLISVQDQVALDVKSVFMFLKESEKRIFVAEKAIEQAEENFRIYQERFKEQVSTSKDVLDAQTLLVRAKGDYYDALSDYCIAWARLKRAMGMIYPEVNKETHTNS
jgi:outer membrane protein